MDDPIADAVRSIVDGHIVLDRKLAHKGHFPAIDILQSTSRVMPSVTTEDHRDVAAHARALLAIYKENEDILAIGAYREGQNENLDMAVNLYPELEKFLKQKVDEEWNFDQSLMQLKRTLLRDEEV